MEKHTLVWLVIIPIIVAIAILTYYAYRKRKSILEQMSLVEIIPVRIQETVPLKYLSATPHQPRKKPPQRPPPIQWSRNAIERKLDGDATYSLKGNLYAHLVQIQDVEEYVKTAAYNGVLRQQYSVFPRGQTKAWDHGKLQQNRKKNRYCNLIAYDETRVILEKLPHDPHSDYINASYIRGYNREKAYIATQGPKPETVLDFWRMIWQEKVNIICMLANLVEAGKIKCTKYWPEIGTQEKYGEVVVHNSEHKVFADYTFRTFTVSCNQQTRQVTHLHYTAWPDHDVPQYSHSIVSYLKKLMSLPSDGPVVVHCSAGVGRSGTIILCDICLRRGAKEGIIDIFTETQKLRKQRANMVDNYQQYLQAHLVIAECLSALETTIPCDKDLLKKIERMKELSVIQQERLRDAEWQDKVLHPGIPRSPQMMTRGKMSRYPDIAHEGHESVTLKRYKVAEESSDHISTVNVDGVKLKNQYVATEYPSPTTLNEFWKLIAECEAELVVLLQLPDNEDSTYCEITEGTEFYQAPYLKITSVSQSETECFAKYKFVINNASQTPLKTQPLTILRYKGWESGIKGKLPSPSSLVELWQASERIRRSGPTIVLCQDGVTGCGLYIALSFLLERISVEQECDVFLAIRAVRRSKPQFVESLEQIEFLYDAALKYTEAFAAYANFQ